jgi:hypothetical protein
MSTDIDMKSYAGEHQESAAVTQTTPDTNSYQQEVHEELLGQEKFPEQVADTSNAFKADQNAEVRKTVTQEPSPQELNFKALREEVDRLKVERETEKREYQQNLDMMRANMANKQSEPKNQMFEGMQEDDIPSVKDIRRAWEQKESDYQARIEELQVAQQYPDYAEVIEKHTLPLVKQKPHLAEGIQGARNKALMAYELGKMAKQMQETPAPVQQKSTIAQKIVENARKPGTLSQSGGQSVLRKADSYTSISYKGFR